MQRVIRFSSLILGPTLVSILASVIIAQAHGQTTYARGGTIIIGAALINALSIALVVVCVGFGLTLLATRLRHIALLISLVLPIIGLLCLWYNLIPPVAWRNIGYFRINLTTALPTQIGAVIGTAAIMRWLKPTKK